MVDIDKINKLPHNQTVIISTGSQGETMSALYRMAFSEHKADKCRCGRPCYHLRIRYSRQ